ncbi:MAG: hypothetical protein V4463_01515 [Pseudomonadota bacterium]
MNAHGAAPIENEDGDIRAEVNFIRANMATKDDIQAIQLHLADIDARMAGVDARMAGLVTKEEFKVLEQRLAALEIALPQFARKDDLAALDKRVAVIEARMPYLAEKADLLSLKADLERSMRKWGYGLFFSMVTMQLGLAALMIHLR